MRFAVDIESYGTHRAEELKQGGKDIRVSQTNKKEYVDLYLDWQFNRSIADLFSRFQKGFYKLYRGEFTTNCDPEELELLICGSPVFNFHELEKITRYDGGYSPTSCTIQYVYPYPHTDTSGASSMSSTSSTKRSSSFSLPGATGRLWVGWARCGSTSRSMGKTETNCPVLTPASITYCSHPTKHGTN